MNFLFFPAREVLLDLDILGVDVLLSGHCVHHPDPGLQGAKVQIGQQVVSSVVVSPRIIWTLPTGILETRPHLGCYGMHLGIAG